MISRANKEHAETLCVDELSVSRRRRADNEVYLNKTLLTDAIRHSLTDLQQVRGLISLSVVLRHPYHTDWNNSGLNASVNIVQ